MTPYAIIFFVACLGKSQSHLSLGAITIEVQIIWVAQGRNYETGPLVFDKSRNSRSSLRGICFLSSSPSDLLGLFRNNLVKLIILGFLCWHANYSLGIFLCRPTNLKTGFCKACFWTFFTFKITKNIISFFTQRIVSQIFQIFELSRQNKVKIVLNCPWIF